MRRKNRNNDKIFCGKEDGAGLKVQEVEDKRIGEWCVSSVHHYHHHHPHHHHHHQHHPLALLADTKPSTAITKVVRLHARLNVTVILTTCALASSSCRLILSPAHFLHLPGHKFSEPCLVSLLGCSRLPSAAPDFAGNTFSFIKGNENKERVRSGVWS